jgi:hypothetical protein
MGQPDFGRRQFAPPSGPRQVAPRHAVPRQLGPHQRPAFREGPRHLPPRVVSPPGHGGPAVGHSGRGGPRVISPPTAARPGGGPRVVSPPVAGRRPPPGRSIEAIRGERRLSIAGRNYSVWRDGHRFRRNGRWWTYAGLGTLGALAIAGATYYPYAYIDTSEPRCEGWTEDGCELRWRRVRTEEGSRVYACVAYCPWQ